MVLSAFGWTYTKIGTIQRRLAWPLRKDDTQNREAFHIFKVRVTRIYKIHSIQKYRCLCGKAYKIEKT